MTPPSGSEPPPGPRRRAGAPPGAEGAFTTPDLPDAVGVTARGTETALDQASVEKIIEDFETEARTRKLRGSARVVVGVAAAGLSLYALYAATQTIPAHVYRALFLAAALGLTFLYYPPARRWRGHIIPLDWALAALAAAALGYQLVDFEELIYRATTPNQWDVVFGVITILLILEAARRTTGWVLPVVALMFLAYAYLPATGLTLPDPWGHRGYSLPRMVGHLYITEAGIFGVPLDVAATFIVLFTIYGAVLEYSRAGAFFINFSFAAMGRKPSGAGRAVTLASFLLGTVSGSGVATTVTLGSIAYPMMRRAGYNPEAAGGVLSAGGIGAILSPPVLGAAAFIIAEYLRVSYLEVLRYAAVPTLLYYLAVFLMIEIDARKMGTHAVRVEAPPMRRLLRTHGYHFLSLFLVVALMALGMTPIFAVFWSILAGVGLSFVNRDDALYPPRWSGGPLTGHVLAGLLAMAGFVAVALIPVVPDLGGVLGRTARLAVAALAGVLVAAALARLAPHEHGTTGQMGPPRVARALESGGLGVLGVAATTAVAGIIVGVVTLTGLGLKLSNIIIDLAGGHLFLTLVYASLAVWVLGLAVPVTASYIIAAVTVVRALTSLGVSEPAAHMFIFYYAVLSEVTPPTALSPFAAAAITGGNPYKTTMLAWKYTLAAFVVPFMFTLAPAGEGLLLRGNLLDIVMAVATAALGIAALVGGVGGWVLHRANLLERVLLVIGGLALTYPDLPADMVGLVLALVAVALQWLTRGRPARV
jgi:TRAP transporter 4TM/12TM fusion protein